MPDWARFDDKAFAEGFTVLPNAAWRLACSAADKAVYFALLSFAWQDDAAYPSVAALAKRVGRSENPVRASLKRLQQIGAISIESRGEGRSHLIRFHRLSEATAALESGPLQNPNPFRNRRGTPSESEPPPLQNLNPTKTQLPRRRKGREAERTSSSRNAALDWYYREYVNTLGKEPKREWGKHGRLCREAEAEFGQEPVRAAFQRYLSNPFHRDRKGCPVGTFFSEPVLMEMLNGAAPPMDAEEEDLPDVEWIGPRHPKEVVQ